MGQGGVSALVVYWVLMCLLKQEGWHMQNASIPSNSIPQAALINHLSPTGQGGVILPNGAVAMVGPLLAGCETIFPISWTALPVGTAALSGS